MRSFATVVRVVPLGTSSQDEQVVLSHIGRRYGFGVTAPRGTFEKGQLVCAVPLDVHSCNMQAYGATVTGPLSVIEKLYLASVTLIRKAKRCIRFDN